MWDGGTSGSSFTIQDGFSYPVLGGCCLFVCLFVFGWLVFVIPCETENCVKNFVGVLRAIALNL